MDSYRIVPVNAQHSPGGTGREEQLESALAQSPAQDDDRVMSVLVLVVLYDCEPDASPTLRSLDWYFPSSLRPPAVMVWNNGPQRFLEQPSELLQRLCKRGCAVELREDLGNRPLSKLYNQVIAEGGFDRLVIFDHDTTVFPDYWAHLASAPNCGVMVPRIMAGDSCQGPRQHGRLVHEGVWEPPGFIAIGSGICLDRDVIDMLAARSGSVFDERYALYGVDTSFFLKLERHFASGELHIHCRGEVQHSLSRMEQEAPERVRFRAHERSYDMGLTLRHYPSRWIRRDTRRMVIRILRGQSDWSLWRILFGFVRGRHPRCRP